MDRGRLGVLMLGCHDQQGVQGGPPFPGQALHNLLFNGVQVALQVTRSGWLVAYKGVDDLAHVKGMQLQLLQDSRKGMCGLCNEKDKSAQHEAEEDGVGRGGVGG